MLFCTKVLADTLGIPVRVATDEKPGSACGAAVYGAAAAGHFEDMASAVRSMTAPDLVLSREYQPNTARREFYDILQERYNELAQFELRRRQQV
mgnify:CR=1 FL=1